MIDIINNLIGNKYARFNKEAIIYNVYSMRSSKPYNINTDIKQKS